MTLQAENPVYLRPAQPEDASQAAQLMIESGNGVYEFLFEGLVPEGALAQALERVISADEGPYSWKNYLVAEREGHLAGFANAFPARLIRNQNPGPIPPERWDHFAPIKETMDWESFYLSNIAVFPIDRGHGVGQALLKGVLAKARQLDFQDVTLHFWEGNDSAHKLYERHGFVVVQTAILTPHSKFAKTRSLAMRCELLED